MEPTEARITELRMRVTELRARLPKHTPSVGMLLELDELETELDELIRRLPAPPSHEVKGESIAQKDPGDVPRPPK